MLDRPIQVGPQYPLMYLSSNYEPDSAFVLKPGDVFIQMSGVMINSYAYSPNSDKKGNKEGSADTFDDEASGYSVYLDAEIDRRLIKTYLGLMDGVELQVTYREVRFGGGKLDKQIDGFHNYFGLGSQGREDADRDQLEIYVYDNEKKEIIWKLTEMTSEFHQESLTLGVKFRVWDDNSDALSLSLSTNFGDAYIESELNEIDGGKENTSFNDYTAALNYSSKSDGLSFYMAAAISYVKESLFENSPEYIYYYFLGANWHLNQNWDSLLQVLNYSSPFPEDGASKISDDIREITMALRWFMGKQGSFELGFVENQTQGPQNIDISFFSSLMVSF